MSPPVATAEGLYFVMTAALVVGLFFGWLAAVIAGRG